MMPQNYNGDTLGIRLDPVGRPIESWGELSNPQIPRQNRVGRLPISWHHGYRHGV
jgi:hypothetical protein